MFPCIVSSNTRCSATGRRSGSCVRRPSESCRWCSVGRRYAGSRRRSGSRCTGPCLTTIYACGLRLLEGARLQVLQIDSARIVLHIRGKGNQDRYVPLPTPLLAMLRSYWRTHRSPMWLFPAPTRHGLAHSLAMPVTRSSLQSIFRRAVRKSGIHKPAHVHTLRVPSVTHVLDEDGGRLRPNRSRPRHQEALLDNEAALARFSEDTVRVHAVMTLALTAVVAALVGLQAQQRSGEPPGSPGTLTPIDYIEIRQLAARYGHAVDTGAAEGDAYASLFAPDGAFLDPAGRPTTGPEALAALAKRTARGPQTAWHYIVNHIIEPTPDGAVGKQFLVHFRYGDPNEPNGVFGGGHYNDVYVKTPDGWRFKSRQFIPSQGTPQSLTPQAPASAR
jgi:hypothetical protein